MLGFFFRHYDELVQRYIIFDDGSNDGSVEILRTHPKVEMRRWQRDPDSFVLSEQDLSNHCWKESRGRADWVIVLDLDEFLFHSALLDYLSFLKSAAVTVVPALGFQMMSEIFPRPEEQLANTRVHGAPWTQMCKCSVFDPDKIEEINFSPGRHRADPIGRVLAPPRDELLNLHYKYLGFDYVVARHRELRGGMGATDQSKNWGTQVRLVGGRIAQRLGADATATGRCDYRSNCSGGELSADPLVGELAGPLA